MTRSSTGYGPRTKAGIDCPLGWPAAFAEPLCRTSHDAFDAVIAALAARAAALNQTLTPDGSQRAPAAVEGWIALPTHEISDLRSGIPLA